MTVTQESSAPATPAAGLDEGTFEVLRARLAVQAAELTRRAEALNARRVGVFGGAELRLLGTERIRTGHNCVPRDIVSVGGLMLFGYNVSAGAAPATTVDHVFSLHGVARDGDGFRFEEPAWDELPGLLRDPQFERDLGELYRYYKQARLMRLRRLDDRLLAVFQTGPRIDDTRVLRWRVAADGAVTYLDNQGERDDTFPAPHEFTWVPTTREHHVAGRHPHITIEDEVFVGTVAGTLTVKIENDTETGDGVYAEPVAEPLQSLADAEVAYARVGALILLRVLPYKETVTRYLVFNTRTRGVVRLDGIGQACLRLPDDHGIVIPGGFHLDTGDTKTFDGDVSGLEFERVIRSPNGEDVLFVFHDRAEGRSLLLPYNVIRKAVTNPVSCHGYSLFDDGTLVVFRALSDAPARVHTMQVWRTPYTSDAYAATRPAGTGTLARIGNADLVRGVSDCLSVARMVEDMTPTGAVFEAIIAACDRIIDHHHWLGEPEAGDLRGPLTALRATAAEVLQEHEKVRDLRDRAATALREAAAGLASLIRRSRGETPAGADDWVRRLTELRQAHGRLVTLRELRYVDAGHVEELTGQVTDELAAAAHRAVGFLRREDAFTGYHREVERLAGDAAAIATVAQAAPVAQRLAEQGDGLQVLTEVIGSLDVADTTVRIGILERAGEVLGGLNRARAILDGRRRELLDRERRGEFAAELGLLGQAITGALAVADSPRRCDEQLGRLLVRLEQLESRFAAIDEFADQLGAKRTDVYEAFTARKQALLDDRSRRADRLVDTAGRILGTVGRRAATLASLEEVNTYFAADPMVTKLHAVAGELRALDDQVRAGELEGRITAARAAAGRALRDRLDLFTDGGDTIRLGRHRFAVNTSPVDLTLVPHDGGLTFTITGTDYHAPVRDDVIEAARPFWEQPLPSESADVYRAEHLASALLTEVGPRALHEVAATTDGLSELVRRAAEQRFDEGYERGVHDHDAALILATLLRLHAGAGLLRYPPAARAAAQVSWSQDTAVLRRAVSLSRARTLFGRSAAIDELCAELGASIAEFHTANGLHLSAGDAALAGEYLFEELSGPPEGFVTSAAARAVLTAFHTALGDARRDLEDDLRALGDDPATLAARHQLVAAWLTSFAAGTSFDPADLTEAVAVQLCGPRLPRYDSSAAMTAEVPGLLGAHPRIVGRTLAVRLDELLARTRRMRTERMPAFRAYQRRRAELVAAERDRLRLTEYTPKVMSGFVRNRLIDEVYLPLIGDNLARQLGASGDGRRSDQLGLLLLISPPGYGKTTLMEYVADRLGLMFVKVNGPALGRDVTSVDPAQAPNATARQEVEKISFALEMGNNVLLHLDDIQHVSPELLQKFISLCDAQRRMEGVWNGRTRTYDLRGKRFAVCMAGNPYTESGQRFHVPDMLANRADVWNLGDVLSGRDELFALSYIENALTTNPVLAPLSTRAPGDVELLVRLARGDGQVRADQLEHSYGPVELDEILAVLRKLLRVQRVVLTVNRAYMASAAQADAARTEPPFRLQGSYRDMNTIAERIVPVMNDAELEAVIDDHYAGEAQTLTGDAEANLLKLAELRGRQSAEQVRRWADVRAAYVRRMALGGGEDDPLVRAVAAVGLLADRVGGVESAIDRATATAGRPGI
ncbi:DNA repair ATPase [Dactylosporangium maewongense]|uniref:DNA repair ATPase n=1 Tax=Dactylosporangium maewongense TaxID=634393 RepID=A0ABN2D6U8_9ACTN